MQPSLMLSASGGRVSSQYSGSSGRPSSSTASSSGGQQGQPELKYTIAMESGAPGQSGTLALTIEECRNLKKGNDTYVQVYLLPGNHKELKTKTQMNSNNPVFGDTFRFQLPVANIPSKTIVLHVMDYDKFSRDDKVGEVQIPLSRLDLSRVHQEWRPLGQITTKPPTPSRPRQVSSSDEEKKSPKRSSSSNIGPPTLRYRVRYERSSRTLVIGVLEAKNLKKTDNFGSAPDPYVQVLFNQGMRDRKTKTVKNSVSPTWNEDFGWEVPLDKVSELTVTLRVFDDDKLSKDDPLGEIVIPLWKVDFASGATEDVKPLQPVTKVVNLLFWTNFTRKNLFQQTTKSQRPPSRQRQSSGSSFTTDEETKKSKTYLGRLKFSLAHDSISGQVVLTIHKAKV